MSCCKNETKHCSTDTVHQHCPLQTSVELAMLHCKSGCLPDM